jgi:beta-N-acetylhexosaminidase
MKHSLTYLFDKCRPYWFSSLQSLLYLIVLLFSLLFISCNGRTVETGDANYRKAREQAFKAQRIREAKYREEARGLAQGLSLEALAAQVLMTGVAGRESLSPDMKKIFLKIPVGAIMLFKYNIADTPRSVYAFIAECSDTAAVPLAESNTASAMNPRKLLPFIALDHEGGDVYRLGQVATRMPPASRYLLSSNNAINSGDSTKSGMIMAEDSWFTIRQAAYLSGRELRALGITMNLAPVAEPLVPENRAFLQNRSFAADPAAVAPAAAAFIQGMGEAGVTSVVKHFPLSAAADPHHGRSVLTVDKKRLSYLVAPFEALLKNREQVHDLDSLYPKTFIALPIQPGGVMVAHTVVTPIDPEVPASLSNRIMQDWMKEALGFSGIVITDDFAMKAITDAGYTLEDAIIRALQAGSDMVMVWPRDVVSVHRLLVERAKSDTLFRDRLIDAATRIINIKLLQGLIVSPEVVPEAFNDEGYSCMKKATEQFLRERNLR